MTVIAVTGMAREARIARRAKVAPVIASGDAQLLSSRLEAAIRAGAKGIISFGIAGALAPLLKPGDVVSHVDGKRRLFAISGAHAVDTESHIAARLARKHAIPFVAVRTISDAAARGLPPAALVPLTQSAHVRLIGVLQSLASEPMQV